MNDVTCHGSQANIVQLFCSYSKVNYNTRINLMVSQVVSNEGEPYKYCVLIQFSITYKLRQQVTILLIHRNPARSTVVGA